MVDPTPADFATTIVTGFAGYGPALLTVGAAGLALAVIMWGFPKIVGFFKKTAK